MALKFIVDLENVPVNKKIKLKRKVYVASHVILLADMCKNQMIVIVYVSYE